MSASLAQQARQLLEQQKSDWGLLARGYESLASVRVRSFGFDGFSVKLQFNPGRIASSVAKVDEKSIRERKCFLCPENLPREQRAIDCGEGYSLLCNPFPIFPEHFTIPNRDHRPQRILESFGSMLRLARELADGYVVFYNGPRSGASAPDHLHFQAGNKGFMPIDADAQLVGEAKYLRRGFVLESDDANRLGAQFARLYQAMSSLRAGGDEPMMNVLAYHDVPSAGWWRVIVLPRAKHRPGFYFADGDERLLLSPGAVDMGGVVISVIERDFNRITKEHLLQLFEEVTLPAKQFDALTHALL
jgi:hypothetical protein